MKNHYLLLLFVVNLQGATLSGQALNFTYQDDFRENLSEACAAGPNRWAVASTRECNWADNCGRTTIYLFDDAGKVLWQRDFGSDSTSGVKRMLALADGGLLIGGMQAPECRYINDLHLERLDANGKLLWQTTLDTVFPGFSEPPTLTGMTLNHDSTELWMTSRYHVLRFDASNGQLLQAFPAPLGSGILNDIVAYPAHPQEFMLAASGLWVWRANSISKLFEIAPLVGSDLQRLYRQPGSTRVWAITAHTYAVALDTLGVVAVMEPGINEVSFYEDKAVLFAGYTPRAIRYAVDHLEEPELEVGFGWQNGLYLNKCFPSAHGLSIFGTEEHGLVSLHQYSARSSSNILAKTFSWEGQETKSSQNAALTAMEFHLPVLGYLIDSTQALRLFRVESRDCYLRLANRGTEPLHSVHLHAFLDSRYVADCRYKIDSVLSSVIDRLDLAPGKDTLLNIGPLHFPAFWEDGVFCFWISMPNDKPDSNLSDDAICREGFFGTGPSAVGLHLFPNPASDKLYVTVAQSGWLAVRFRIYSALGQQVYHEFVYNYGELYELDISGLAQGLYFLKVGDEVVPFVRN